MGFHGGDACGSVNRFDFHVILVLPQSGPGRKVDEDVLRDDDWGIQVRVEDLFSLG